MFPVYERSDRNRFGDTTSYPLTRFIERFDEICKEHDDTRKTKRFALIFYDFDDKGIKKTLHSKGVFTELDRLTADKLDIFFMDSGSRAAVRRFNSTFLEQLKIKARPPCIAFIKLSWFRPSITVAALNGTTLHHLYQAIDSYLKDAGARSAFVGWTSRAAKWAAMEGLKEAVKALIRAT